MTNKLVTITQLCLGAYLYSTGTQHRNLLKLLVMTSMVICHQKIKGYMNTELIILKKTHLFQSFSNNLYRTHLISSNNKRDMHAKMTPPFFFKVCVWCFPPCCTTWLRWTLSSAYPGHVNEFEVSVMNLNLLNQV